MTVQNPLQQTTSQGRFWRVVRILVGIFLVLAAVFAIIRWRPWVRSVTSPVEAQPVEVIKTVVVEVEVVVTATPSPTPTANLAATATPEPTVTIVASGPVTATMPITETELSDLTVGELVELLVKLQPGLAPQTAVTATQPVTEVVATQWFTATGFSTQVEPLKEDAPNCELPMGCNVVADPGVLGADSLEEADANPSAIWTGAWHHQIGDQSSMGLLVPQGSYATAYASGMTLTGDGFELVLPEFGWDGVWGLLVRGSHDYPLATSLTNHGAPGALGYTRYPVPREAGEYFSEDYLTAQAANSLEFDNCHVDGCLELRQAILDVNDMSLTILRYTAEKGWEVLWTNVQDPSTP